MPAAFPPDVRAAVVAARLGGARVSDVARELGISTSLVTKWSQEAGIGPEPACKVCQHPQLDEIDAALIDNTVAVVADLYPDVTCASLDRHRRVHLAITLGQGPGFRCAACDHMLRSRIDALLRLHWSRTRLAEEFGIEVYVLRHHQFHHLDNPHRDAAVARAEESRLQAARRLAERVGPPRGWLYCPECDSDNVHCAGSGDWREDPGPIHWYVAGCFDCGWPNGD
jgi:hypothetical protein